MREFAKIVPSDSRGFSVESARSTCPASDNFRKVRMLDHEYSGTDSTVASGFDSEESDRAFFVLEGLS